MLIRHAMTRHPLSVEPTASCRDALALFQENCVRHATVLEEGALVGVVSERDLVRALPHSIGQLDSAPTGPLGPQIRAVMAGEPQTCGLNDPIDEVALRMKKAKIGCMPVLDQEGLVGIVTVTDLLHGFADQFEEANGWPVTLVWTHGDRLPRPDIAALSVIHGLRLSRLFESRMDGGSNVFLIRLHGPEGALEAFLRSCEAAHLGVLKSFKEAA